ncbi:S-methyl-5-thioribose-1-phosphate isomerase [Bacillota bacterium LX-D]|nr:S-methyl-5-thioribose-1-phosphate isomerase [Bacillota bacterium LX-D]
MNLQVEVKSIEFLDNVLYLLDQRCLPLRCELVKCRGYQEVVYAIKEMVVRGAPAIGSAGAYGIVLAAQEFMVLSKAEFLTKMAKASETIAEARPTAVNLVWAVRRMNDVLFNNQNLNNEAIYQLLKTEADQIALEDVETNKQIARLGNTLIPQGVNILTHCNTGALATVGYGTALGIIREAHGQGKNIHVYADETRPRLQGARLTAWELVQEGIPATLIPDTVAPTLIRDGKIDLILVGADRIALNGDTANKIGTYMLSEIAKHFNVPFYIAAPLTTVDFAIETGKEIVIEERDEKEVTHIGNERIAPPQIKVYNPAFDVTPYENITGIITERGILHAPYKPKLLALK